MSTEKTIKVKDSAQLKFAIDAGYTADQIIVDHSEAESIARASGIEEGKKIAAAAAPDADAIRAAADKAERERITAINEICRAGFEAERKAAIDAGDSAEKFALAMLMAAKDRGVTLEAIVKDSPTAAPHAKPSATKEQVSWDSTIAKFVPKGA